MENEQLEEVQEEQDYSHLDGLPESSYVDPDTFQPQGTTTITPEVVEPTQGFDAPFRSPIGRSTVDLNIAANEKRMLDEYKEWWHYGKKRFAGIVPYNSKEFKGERDKLKDAWYQKYHSMGLAEYDAARQAQPKKTLYGYDANLKGIADQIDNNFQALSVPTLNPSLSKEVKVCEPVCSAALLSDWRSLVAPLTASSKTLFSVPPRSFTQTKSG